MVRLFWCCRPEIFQNFRNVLKGSPKFPNGRCVYHLGFSPVPSPTPILTRVTCHLEGVVHMVRANPDRNFSLGIFVYYLYKPSINRFSHVNGKQLLSLGRLRQEIVQKCVPHLQHDFSSPFNQSEHCFLVSSLPLLKLLISNSYNATSSRGPTAGSQSQQSSS